MGDVTTADAIGQMLAALERAEEQRAAAEDLLARASANVDQRVADLVAQVAAKLAESTDAATESLRLRAAEGEERLRGWVDGQLAEFEAGREDWLPGLLMRVEEVLARRTSEVDERVDGFLASKDELVADVQAEIEHAQRRFATAMAIADQRLDVLALSIGDTEGEEVWRLISTAVDQVQPLLEARTGVEQARDAALVTRDDLLATREELRSATEMLVADLASRMREAQGTESQLREIESTCRALLAELEGRREELERLHGETVRQRTQLASEQNASLARIEEATTRALARIEQRPMADVPPAG